MRTCFSAALARFYSVGFRNVLCFLHSFNLAMSAQAIAVASAAVVVAILSSVSFSQWYFFVVEKSAYRIRIILNVLLFNSNGMVQYERVDRPIVPLNVH